MTAPQDYIDDRHALRVHYQEERCRYRTRYDCAPGIRDAFIALTAVEYRHVVEVLRAYHIYETVEPCRVTRRRVMGDNGSYTT